MDNSECYARPGSEAGACVAEGLQPLSRPPRPRSHLVRARTPSALNHHNDSIRRRYCRRDDGGL